MRTNYTTARVINTAVTYPNKRYIAGEIFKSTKL